MTRKIDLIKLMWLWILHSKTLIISYCLLIVFNLVILANPYVNNSGDFVTTSNYLIFAGLFFTFVWSFSAGSMLVYQSNFQLMKEQEFTFKNAGSAYALSLSVVFTVFHFISLLLFNIYYSFIFSFNTEMFINISILYINYFFLSYSIPFLIGLYLSMVFKKFNSMKKAVCIIISILLIIGCAINIRKMPSIINLFYADTRNYYNPFTGIENFNYALLIKILISVFLIGLLIIHLNFKSKKGRFFANLILIFAFLPCSFFVFERNYQSNMHSFYIASHIKEYYKNKNPITTHYSKDYSISSYNIDISEDIPKFKVDVHLRDIRKKDLTFYINEAFKISNISVDNIQVPFEQQGKSIYLELKTTENQVVTFVYSGKGTSLNPVQKNYMFLPYFFNWLPGELAINDYVVMDNSAIEFNNLNRTCRGNKRIHSNLNKLYIQTSENQKCLTLVKGDFMEKIKDGKKIYYPKVWSGNVGEINDYSSIMNKATKLFNDIFNENKSINYNNLLIVPKYEIDSQPSFNDIWIQDSYQIILVDPFLNNNEESLFNHISKISIFNTFSAILKDRTVEDNKEKIELLSLLFGIYFMEKNNIPNNGSYLDHYISLNGSKEVIIFQNLDLDQKKNKLIELYKSLT